ncbi:4-hydroxybenzoate octaprenyltransferase [Tropicimonas isoalkanivorans]|uniref:4-hydroxybenzoate octaprenyltransferase n=1 Tax=Tropicimonas isoalkanivorans TaxID=441112 RepID=A0A1I1NEK4_9RHOB|nr:4-hydroxybenzoate octaprenyltransferase [Tropicimonas isoalkanivorans]SFC93203.1 4-hydroxybenzoate polyprenyltransferase [Tropicimonas isoalkanivorans]
MTDSPNTPDTPTTQDATDSAQGPVADAVQGNWVDGLAPLKARPYLRLSRADRPVGFWTLIIPSLWGLFAAAAATGWRAFDWWILIAVILGSFLMRGAGCTWNDITDREIDARVERTRSRPLPSGQVTVKNATIWMGVQLLLAFAILLTFNTTAIWVGVASLLLIVLYPFGKRITWWPQFILGLNLSWGALVAWAAHTGEISVAPLFLFFGGVSWTIYYDTIYAHQDIDDDTLIGVKSTARLFGKDTPAWLRLFMMITVLMLTVGVIAAFTPSRSPLSLAIALVGAWGMGMHMSWLMARLDLEDPQSCLKAFRALTHTGLIFAVALLLALLV